MHKSLWSSWLLCSMVAVACGSGESGPAGSAGSQSSGSGGAVGGEGSVGSGGASANAARSGSGAGTAGGGAGGRAAGAGAGGTSVGGAGRSGTGGTGGAIAGAGGTMGGGGAGGSTPVMASAGCGKMSGKPTATSIPNTIVTFPDGYDGSQPMPLVFGFHGANRTNANFQTSDTRIGGSDLEKNFVMAYIKSTGSGWVVATDTARLDMAYTQLTQNYCIDVNRVYATGHSSGAQMIVQLLCNGEKRFKAVAPVAASKYCAKVSPIATLYIQGMRDAMRGNGSGKDVVDVFASSNMCGSMTLAENVPTCNSSLDGAAVTPGCIAYQGCSAPLVWCSHNDNSYNATDGNMHGWPCFATKLIYDFFSKSK